MSAGDPLEPLRAPDGALVGELRCDREQLVRYAGASGDYNRVHWDPELARAVGFGDVIVHGMLTMAHVARAITSRLARPTDLRSLRVRFRREVLVGERVEIKARVVSAPGAETLELELWAELTRDGELLHPVTDGRAIVRAGAGRVDGDG